MQEHQKQYQLVLELIASYFSRIQVYWLKVFFVNVELDIVLNAKHNHISLVLVNKETSGIK
jgi:hypothetical protein